MGQLIFCLEVPDEYVVWVDGTFVTFFERSSLLTCQPHDEQHQFVARTIASADRNMFAHYFKK